MRLRELAIENFGCIGSPGVTIRIDNIVVLVGANNVGKSTVLKAYREFAGTGTGLPLDDFHDKSSKNEVMIAGVFSDLTAEDTELIGSKWEFDHGEYGPSVKYRWVWTTPEAKGRKQSWNENEKEWEDGGMGGWDSKVASCVPTPLEISPLEDSGTIEKKVIEILASAVKKTVQSDDARLATLVAEFEKLATEVQAEIGESINAITSGVESYLTSVFPDHKVNIRPAAGKFDPEKIIANGSFVEIKDSQGGTQPLIRQGTGLQRTFLWSAIGALADNSKYKDGKKTITRNTPRILMVEEPEVFLHPPAIRSAREALYGVAEVENW